MNAEFIIQALISFLGGGGLSWLFFYRRRLRREGSKLHKEEFDAVSEIVNKAMGDMQHLSNRIAELESEKMRVLEEISKKAQEIEKLNTTIRRLLRNNNPEL